MLSFLAFWVLLGDEFTLDELYVKRIVSAATHGPSVVFTSFAGFDLKTYWFHLEEETGTVIDDQRAKLHLPGIVATKDGFCMVQTVGRPMLVLLDVRGNFLTSQRLEAYAGWDDELILKNINGYHNRHLAHALTQDQKKLLVGNLDLERRQIAWVHSFEQPENQAVNFHPWGDGYLQVNMHTGQLAIFSSDFSEEKVLRTGLDPLRFDPKRFSRLAKRFKYRAMLEVISVQEERVVFAFNKPDSFAAEKYPEPLKRILTLENRGLVESTTIILGEHLGKKLVYDRIEQEFAMIKETK